MQPGLFANLKTQPYLGAITKAEPAVIVKLLQLTTSRLRANLKTRVSLAHKL
jgi:hypothetical protein